MNKAVFTLFILLMGFSINASSQVIALEGHYQGRDIYVQNPFSASGVGFCVYEVRVNGLVTTDEINSSAFSIDLSLLNLNFGDPVTIKISHKDGCDPIVINPEALKPLSTFEVVNISVSESGLLKWATVEESGSLDFIIEQFRWNKWVKVGEVKGVGSPKVNKYQFQVVSHYGVNKVRVKQIDSTKKPRYSIAMEYDPDMDPVTFTPLKVKKDITFSSKTMYEVYNMYGNIVAKGYSETFNTSGLEKGKYYLNYDNNFGETFQKK